jgi:hypothetical protein
MAPSAKVIQRLIEARIASYELAFEDLDIVAVQAWQYKDIVFKDIGTSQSKHMLCFSILTRIKRSMNTT